MEVGLGRNVPLGRGGKQPGQFLALRFLALRFLALRFLALRFLALRFLALRFLVLRFLVLGPVGPGAGGVHRGSS
ncbi:hypothetical protein [Streptomyces sp. NPDC056669]|uniref:hypothetical protein n=1 Tax=Streptomyces sp. NPDC056669 TaxID=3345903 RepID=UPI0036CBB5C6